MKTIKVAEASKLQLDYLVAVCEGATGFASDGITLGFKLRGETKVLATGWAPTMSYHPTIHWGQMGLIIDREDIEFVLAKAGGHHESAKWMAVIANTNFGFGEDHLVAAARCHIMAKLGETAEVPEELQ